MRSFPSPGRLLLLATLCLPLAALSAVADEQTGDTDNTEQETTTAVVIVPRGQQCTMLSPDVDFETVDLDNGLGVRITAKNAEDVQLIQKSVDYLMLQKDIARMETERSRRMRTGLDSSRRGELARTSFNKMDRNRDGRVSRGEFGEDDTWERLQKEHDANQDQTLDENEWQTAQQSERQRQQDETGLLARHDFSQLDQDGNGTLSKSEVDSNRLWQQLQQHDRNNDQKISRSEWQNAKNPDEQSGKGAWWNQDDDQGRNQGRDQARTPGRQDRDTENLFQGKDFGQLDQDGNGTLTRSEVDSSRLWQELQENDRNNDQRISQSEWRQARQETMQGTRGQDRGRTAMERSRQDTGPDRWQRLMEHDRDDSDTLSQSEWQNAERELRRGEYGTDQQYGETEYTFQDVDQDGDGEITGQELRRADERQQLFAQAEQNVRSTRERETGRWGRNMGDRSGWGGSRTSFGTNRGNMRNTFCASQVAPMLGLMAQDNVEVSTEKLDQGVLVKFTSEQPRVVKKLKVMGKLHETWSELEKSSMEQGRGPASMHGGMNQVMAKVLRDADVSIERTDQGVNIQVKAQDSQSQEQLHLLAKMAKLSHDLQRLEDEGRGDRAQKSGGNEWWSEDEQGRQGRGSDNPLQGKDFGQLDQDGDGTLSKSEVEDRVWQKLQKHDRNNDQKISRSEWQNAKDQDEQYGRSGASDDQDTDRDRMGR